MANNLPDHRFAWHNANIAIEIKSIIDLIDEALCDPDLNADQRRLLTTLRYRYQSKWNSEMGKPNG